MKNQCTHDDCQKEATIATYNGENTPYCFKHYMLRAEQEIAAEQAAEEQAVEVN